MKQVHTWQRETEGLKWRINALWEAVEQIRQALPRCAECDALLKSNGTSIGREYCSDGCHQVANHA